MSSSGSRIWRWSKRIVFVTVLLAIVLVGIVMVAIHTDWGREKIRARVESILQQTFPGGARIAKLEGSPFRTITIHGIEIRSLDGTPAITVAKVEVTAAMRPLLEKRVEIASLVVEDVHVVAGAPLTRPSKDEGDDKPDDTSEPSPWSFEVAAFEVHRATIEVPDGPTGGPMTLEDATVTGTAKLPAGAPIEAAVTVAATWKERGLPVRADARFVISDGATIPTATASVGEVALAARDLSIDTIHPSGRLTVVGTVAALAALDPRIDAPGDVALTITATSVAGSPNRARWKDDGRRSTAMRHAAADVLATQLDIAGTLDGATLHVAARGNVTHQWVDAYVGLGAADLGKLTRGRVVGRGELAMVAHADRDGVHGLAGIRGDGILPGGPLPATDATLVVDTTWDRAELVALASAGDVALAAAATARIDRTAGEIAKVTIDEASVVATGKDFTRATGGLVELASPREVRVEGRLDKPATLVASTGAAEVVASGTARGTKLAYGRDLRVGDVDVRFGGEIRVVRSGTTPLLTGWANADAHAIAYAGKPQGSASVSARYARDGTIHTQLRARPAAVPIAVELAADVTIGKPVGDKPPVIDITLGEHRVTPDVGPAWTGRGGHVAIADTIALRGFSTTNGAGRARIDAAVVPATGALDATVDATQFALATFVPTIKGTVSGKLVAKRRGARWDATGDFSADTLVIAPDRPRFSGTAHLEAHGRDVRLDTHATSPELGGVRLALDIEGPRDLTDPLAWRRLERPAVRTARLTIEDLELTNLSPDTGGTIDGSVQIGAATDATKGTLAIKSVRTPLGIAQGQVALSPLADDLYASWALDLSDVGQAKLATQIRFPQHPFDPVAWQQLGRGVVRSVVASFDDIDVEPQKLAKLGIAVPYRGRADVKLAVGAAATAAKLDIDLREVEGGALRRPVDVHVEARTDASETKACAWIVRAGAQRSPVPQASGGSDELCLDAPDRRVIALENVVTPMSFATWVNAPKTALAATLAGKLVVPSQSARGLMLIFGRDVIDPKKGTIGGEIALRGTLGKPGAKGAITANHIKLVSGISVRENPELTKLEVAIDWVDRGGRISITANESHGGELSAKLIGQADNPQAAVTSLYAKNLDLAPLAAFLPGELGASQGTLRGAVIMNGLDPATAKIRGDLHIDGLYVPIAPVVGTLHDGRVNVLMSDAGLSLDARGIMNSCKTPKCLQNVRLDARMPPDLGSVVADLKVSRISTLGEIEPVIDANAHAELRRTGRKWIGTIDVTDGFVEVPPSVADDLLDAEDPSDVFFVEKPPPPDFFDRVREPEKDKIFLEAKINLGSTRIDVEEYAVIAWIHSEDLVMRVGDTIGLTGKLVVERGEAEIVGRHYKIKENEIVRFDNTIDPEVDLQLEHEFPGAFTMTVLVQGKVSDPDFPRPHFTGGNYTEGELFGFLLGGDPSGDRGAQTKDATISAGGSILSQALAKRVKKYLPRRLTLDVIKCEPGTTAAGASCTFGKRFLDDDLYIAYKRRLQPLPNENADEAQLQYYLSREWFFEGVGGSANIIGADLLWRRRW